MGSLTSQELNIVSLWRNCVSAMQVTASFHSVKISLPLSLPPSLSLSFSPASLSPSLLAALTSFFHSAYQWAFKDLIDMDINLLLTSPKGACMHTRTHKHTHTHTHTSTTMDILSIGTSISTHVQLPRRMKPLYTCTSHVRNTYVTCTNVRKLHCP